MYIADDQDRVVERFDLPQCSPAAPCTLVLGGGGRAAVAYITQRSGNGHSGLLPEYAVVTFDRVLTQRFGWPCSDELRGHPLYEMGLEHYSFCEITGSSWVRSMMGQDAAGHRHSESPSCNYRHFILTFRDSTFECIAGGYRFITADGAEKEIIEIMGGCLRDG